MPSQVSCSKLDYGCSPCWGLAGGKGHREGPCTAPSTWSQKGAQRLQGYRREPELPVLLCNAGQAVSPAGTRDGIWRAWWTATRATAGALGVRSLDVMHR